MMMHTKPFENTRLDTRTLSTKGPVWHAVSLSGRGVESTESRPWRGLRGRRWFE